MLKTKQLGFTLIEVMVVIVIVSILMAIALPSYRNSVLKSHRSDGTSGLTQCAALQERWFTKNNVYNANACPSTSPEGYYDLSVAVGDMQDTGNCDPGSTSNNDCFEITATPTSKASQDDDTDCATIMLDNTNFKEADNSDGDSTTDVCW